MMSFKEKIVGFAIVAASWFGIGGQSQASAQTDKSIPVITKIFGIDNGQLKRGYDRVIVDGTRRGLGRFGEKVIQGVANGVGGGSSAVQKTVEHNLRQLVNHPGDYHFEVPSQVTSQAIGGLEHGIYERIDRKRAQADYEYQLANSENLSPRERAELERAAARSAEKYGYAQGGSVTTGEDRPQIREEQYQETTRKLSPREIAEAQRAADRAAGKQRTQGNSTPSNQQYLDQVRAKQSSGTTRQTEVNTPTQTRAQVDTQTRDETKVQGTGTSNLTKKTSFFKVNDR